MRHALNLLLLPEGGLWGVPLSVTEAYVSSHYHIFQSKNDSQW